MNQKKIEDFTNVTKKDYDSQNFCGWKKIKLKDISTINPSKKEIQYIKKNIEVSFIPMSYIDDNSGTIVQQDTINIDEIRRKGYKYFREGDVLFARITPCMENGKCVITDNLTNQLGFGSTEYHVIRPNKYILAKWIQLFLRQQIIRDEAVRHFTGSVGQQRVPENFLQNLLIPLPFSNGQPDLELQQRIVQRIEELFYKIQQIERLKKIMKIEVFLKSICYDIFSKIQQEGRVVNLKDISDNPQYGYTASANSNQIGPKFLRITDIQNGIVDWNTVPYCKISNININNYRIKKEDIFFARTGATTGKTFFIKSIEQEAVFASYLIRVQIQKDIVLPEYIYHFFQSPQYWEQITPQGGAQPHMNAQRLMKLKVPIPFKNKQIDFLTQEKVINFLNKINNYYITLIKINLQTSQELESLKQSILHKAFNGELVKEN